MAKNIVRDKSFILASQIVDLAQTLQQQKEFILSNQILRSGTSIGANIRESEFAQSNADFVSKLSIALKEANETQYWLELLLHGKYIQPTTFQTLNEQIKEIIALLVTSIKTLKSKANA